MILQIAFGIIAAIGILIFIGYLFEHRASVLGFFITAAFLSMLAFARFYNPEPKDNQWLIVPEKYRLATTILSLLAMYAAFAYTFIRCYREIRKK